MKVRMLDKIKGTRNGLRWPEAGEVVDLPDAEAADLCSQGVAEPVRGYKIEAAVAPEPEKAVAAPAAKKAAKKQPARKKA